MRILLAIANSIEKLIAIGDSIVEAQAVQDALAFANPGQRRFYELPPVNALEKLLLRLILPRALFERIQWTPFGAIYLARKDHELA
jgi:hypothetical protein